MRTRRTASYLNSAVNFCLGTDILSSSVNHTELTLHQTLTTSKVKQQKCLAHLIRNADEVAAGEQSRPGRGEGYGQRVAQVFRDGIRLHRDVTMGGCTREEYAQQGEGLTLRLDTLLNRAPLKSKAKERLRLGLLKQHVLDRLWPFLKDPDIPPTNNAAERSLRTVVMSRKVSQCSKNALGAQT
ncbi:IS66 family transposase [Deinococcus marmoris]|uniref:IS66 family transposase n=1 Tax=Deinococcus marmoris TaxID=249408 RepID=UPI0034C62151